MKTTCLPPTLAERTARLHNLHGVLSARHFGIDQEIQNLLDAFSPWYKFAEAQTRPRTIGLWGMTGTGKSSLVHRLVEATGMDERTFWLDAGEMQNGKWFNQVIEHLESNLSGQPFILVVDEFQHARTTNLVEKSDPEAANLRKFWELLDTGMTTHLPNQWHLTDLKDFLGRFSRAVQAGLKLQKGRVVEGHEIHKELMERHYRYDHQTDWCIPGRVLEELRHLLQAPQPSITEMEDRVAEMDHSGVLIWLEEILRKTERPWILDARMMLVVLLGNLDELYVVDKQPMADIHPDVLLKRHRDIGLAGVQSALRKLFRIEQVGRMGTSHIVFPPIGSAVVNALVASSVERMEAKLSEHCGQTIQVDPSLVDHLRSTSAIAVLGARPVVQAVQNTVPLLLSHAMEQPHALQSSAIQLAFTEGIPQARFTVEGKIHETPLPHVLPPREDQPNSNNELLWVALHEAGHLLCGTLLCNKRPLQAAARSRDSRISGFVLWEKGEKDTCVRSEVVPELAVMLGGWAAECHRYGYDGISSGSSSDIHKATAFALSAAKDWGLGPARIKYADHQTSFDTGFHLPLAEAEAQARAWIKEAEALALKTVSQHANLLELYAMRLLEKGSLGMEELDTLLGNENLPATVETTQMQIA